MGPQGDKKSNLEHAQIHPRRPVDLSSWFLHMRVHRLQGSGWVDQTVIITEDVIAFKYCDHDSEYDAVIGLEDMVSCQDMSKLANSQNSRMWHQEGLSHTLFSARVRCECGPSAETY